MSKRATVPLKAAVTDLVGRLRLSRIRLKTLVVRGERAQALIEQEELTLGVQFKVHVHGVQGDAVEFEVGVRAWAPRDAAPTDALLFIQCERLVTYSGLTPGTPSEALDAFGKTSVPLVAWPYLRSDVHSACLELDFPPILLALVKSPPPEQPGLVAEGGAASPQQALRADLLDALVQLDTFLDPQGAACLDRPAASEVSEPWRSLGVNALRAQHSSLKRRLLGETGADECEGLVQESEQFVRQVEDAVRMRRKILRLTNPEARVRWDEFASDFERVMRGATRLGHRAGGAAVKLVRLGR